MKKILLIFITFTIVNCNNQKNKCLNETTILNFDGYGIVKFQKSHYGSIRDIEFFPFCDESNTDKTTSGMNVDYSIILRETNSSKLWQSLINDRRIKLDNYNYGFAIIKIKYSYYPINKGDICQSFINHSKIKGVSMKLKTYSTSNIEMKVDSFKIIKNLD